MNKVAAAAEDTPIGGRMLKRRGSFVEEACAFEPSPDEPISKTIARFWAVLLFVCLPLMMLFGVMYTDIGWGAWFYRELTSAEAPYKLVVLACFGVLFVMYLFDASSWTGGLQVVKRLLVVALALTVTAAGVLAVHQWPFLPLLIFMCFILLAFWYVKVVCYANTNTGNYLVSLSRATMLCGASAVVVYLTWVVAPHCPQQWASPAAGEPHRRGPPDAVPSGCVASYEWSPVTKELFQEKIGCLAEARANLTGNAAFGPRSARAAPFVNATETEADVVAAEACSLASFMLYAGHIIAAGFTLILSYAMYLLGSSIVNASGGSSARRRHATPVGVKIFGSLVLASLMGMWIAASIAGASMRLSSAVSVFSGATLVAIVVLLGATVGWASLTKEARRIPLVRKMAASAASDWMRAIAVLWGAPLFCAYLGASWCNQRVRLWLRAHGMQIAAKENNDDGVDEKALSLTLIAHKQVRLVRSWDWTGVLTKVNVWGCMWYVFSVGVSKWVTVFLAALNTTLQDPSVSTSTVIGIFYAVGLSMFLLPPVPGVPVYVVGGLLVVKKLAHTMNFWSALFAVVGIGFALKLNAICIQQKVFGELLGRRVGIRVAVGVNSSTMKTIRFILERPGLSIAKVAILCGGPDWPTSVITGILGLSLPQMLLGSVPVLVLVAPCVMAGAFMVKAEEGGVWGSAATTTLALAAMAQAVAMIAALYFISDVLEKEQKKIEAIPDDEEVAEHERKSAIVAQKYKDATAWPRLPAGAKLALGTSALLAITATWMYQFLSCFRLFGVNDEIGAPIGVSSSAGATTKRGLGGSALNIVLPMGQIAHGVMFGGWLIWLCFVQWAKCRVNKGVAVAVYSPPLSRPDGRDEEVSAAVTIEHGEAMLAAAKLAAADDGVTVVEADAQN